jgi:FAD/FMN-containing dehydrogenase
LAEPAELTALAVGLGPARAAFEEIVGREHVIRDRDVVASYESDWTGRFVGHCEAVIRPGSYDEVSAIVALCSRAGIALTLQGGNTGLVGGSVPLHGEVVLSMRRLDDIGDVDPVAGQVTAGCGATVGDVQRAAAAAGWSYGVDLSSRDSATIGGTIATNAGGLRAVHFGHTRAQVAGIEAVLGNGLLVSHLGGLWKDNTGYDFASLLCGSEGTLGVVTAARLRLVTPAAERAVVLLAFDDVASAVVAAGGLRRYLTLLEAVELFLQSGLDLVCSASSVDPPFPDRHAAYVLVEAAGASDPTDDLAAAVESIEGVAGVAIASSPSRRAALWHYREAHTESIATIGVAHKMDVSVPLDLIAELVARVPGVVEAIAPGAQTWLWGHAADGNIHVNVTGLAGDDDAVDGAVLELVASLGGSISAEHGIGTAKRRWLSLNRSPAEIEAMRAIKRALDPAGILNPNVLL